MNTETVFSILRQQLKSIKPKLPDELPAGDHFKSDWNLDSLDLVEFIARIEQEFGILIPDQDLPEFSTLQASVCYIQDHLSV